MGLEHGLEFKVKKAYFNSFIPKRFQYWKELDSYEGFYWCRNRWLGDRIIRKLGGNWNTYYYTLRREDLIEMRKVFKSVLNDTMSFEESSYYDGEETYNEDFMAYREYVKHCIAAIDFCIIFYSLLTDIIYYVSY